MATRQQAGRFLEPPPLQSAGGHNMTLTNRMID